MAGIKRGEPNGANGAMSALGQLALHGGGMGGPEMINQGGRMDPDMMGPMLTGGGGGDPLAPSGGGMGGGVPGVGGMGIPPAPPARPRAYGDNGAVPAGASTDAGGAVIPPELGHPMPGMPGEQATAHAMGGGPMMAQMGAAGGRKGGRGRRGRMGGGGGGSMGALAQLGGGMKA